MKRILFLAAVLAASVPAFAQQRKTTERYEHHQARVLDAVSNAYVKPLVVDLVIDKSIGDEGKIEHTWTLDKTQAEVALGGDLGNIHSWGTYQTAREYKCDVVVAATFNLEFDSNTNVYRLTVTGFAGKYVNWKPAEKSDEWWIELENGKAVSDAEKTSPINK